MGLLLLFDGDPCICNEFAGESFRSLSYHFRINHTSIGQIVEMVCRALNCRLQPVYMKVSILSQLKCKTLCQ